MSRQIALFRGINVGRARRIAMADLRELAGELGFAAPRTLLNSGNLVYDAPGGAVVKNAARLEQAVADQLGVSSRVTVITVAELNRVTAENTLVDVAQDPSRLLVAIPRRPPLLKRLEPLGAGSWQPEGFALGTRAAYIWSPKGVLDSRVAKAVGERLGDDVTTRNWKTLCRLVEMVSGA